MNPVVVTATTNPARALACLRTWDPATIVVVVNGPAVKYPPEFVKEYTSLPVEHYLGTVPAFRHGIDYVLEALPDADPIICLHDDVEIADPEWLRKVVRAFEARPAMGLAGFGGAIGLGAETIYQMPYSPMQLARIGFRSNLTDAEVHGIRSTLPERVACLDGFSQIGRRQFFEGWVAANLPHTFTDPLTTDAIDQIVQRVNTVDGRPWTYLEEHGFVHHFYDGALGCLAARAGWEAWYLPIRCKHLGGQTAVADVGYQAWAKTQIPGGDQGFWEQSHKHGYELFNDVLPLRV